MVPDHGNPDFTPSNYPVINGVEISTDQRGFGFERVHDLIPGGSQIDIGAYEIGLPKVIELVISNKSDPSDARSYFQLVNEFDKAAGDQVRALPFSTSNRIEITFSESVVGVEGDELKLRSIVDETVTYPVLDKGWVAGKNNTYAWESNHQAIENFPEKDHVLLELKDEIFNAAGDALDGNWINPTAINPTLGEVDMISEFPSGDGLQGGAFHFVFTTFIPGDFDNSNFVGQGDLDLVLLYWGSLEINFSDPNWVTEFVGGNGLIGQNELDVVLLNWALDLTDLPDLIGDTNDDGMVNIVGDYEEGMSMEEVMEIALNNGVWFATNMHTDPTASS